MSTAQQLLKKFSPTTTPQVTKATTDEEKGRVTVGRIFAQPTGLSKGKPNYKVAYWGFLGDDGKFLAGFTMNNRKVLEMVQANMLTKDMLKTFEAYADKHAANHVVI